MVIHQLAANDDEDDQLKAEQVNIVDPPQDQLREPALDVLAPLITEDYRRPAPPPQRVTVVLLRTQKSAPYAMKCKPCLIYIAA